MHSRTYTFYVDKETRTILDSIPEGKKAQWLREAIKEKRKNERLK